MTVAMGSRKVSIGAIVAIVGGALALVGGFLAWETVSAELVAGSGLATSQSGLEFNGGKIIVVCGIIALVLAALNVLEIKIPVSFAITVTVVGAVATFVGVANYFSVTDEVNKANAIVAGLGGVGIGLYIAILGSVVILVGGVLGLVMKKN